MRKMLRLDDLEVFLSTAERGSLSAAARALDISPALASAALKRLEDALQLRLLARTTRSLRLTAEGEQYLRHAREALRQLREGHDAIRQGQQALAGLLKISMPSDLGRNVLLPWLDAFQAAHPAIALQLFVSDRVADMYRQPVDLALRYGKLDDSSMVAMPIAPGNRRVLVAAPRPGQGGAGPGQPQQRRCRFGAPLGGRRRRDCLQITAGRDRRPPSRPLARAATRCNG